MARRRTKTASALARAERIARNLWWTWHPPAKRLLEGLDPELWRASGNNPLRVLASLSPERRRVLEADVRFARALTAVEKAFDRYGRTRSWFDREIRRAGSRFLAAYFCMEYGLHESFPLYAGGLGILAGDHLRSASDLGVPLVGVGILWKFGYYRQEITPAGDVRVVYPPTPLAHVPAVETGTTITVPIGRSTVRAKVWRVGIGRVPLYLLDTDSARNTPKNRALTHHLYGGDGTDRIRQEVLLGVGGLLALDALGVRPTVFHLNEGHAAFCPLERVARLVDGGLSAQRAIARVRASSVFTTHTPVPAGNDRFDPALFRRFMGGYAKRLGMTQQELLALGREDPADRDEPFCMTVLALKTAERCNGVAELHGDTSRKMWQRSYGAPSADIVPIGHVTNGVHPEMWLSDDARPFYDTYLKPRWNGAGPDDDWWARAKSVPAKEMWALRCALRRRLVSELRGRLREQILGHFDDPSQLEDLLGTLDEDALTIGFARRFAPYKRAPLMFSDPDRLAKLLTRAGRPVQVIFAGKAHPMDELGHAFVRKVHRFTRAAPFRGRVFILQNYDMEIGRLLTQGCDVWLNNPVRPLEASGTSGMKPPLQGGLNVSVLDGWWPEGYDGRNGWVIGDAEVRPSRKKQDAFDAESLYRVLEREVVPTFYDRGRDGVPRAWCRMMADSMRSICCRFSSHRMVAEYVRDYYLPAR